ncbi:hypothetical protein PoB_003083700 [Plakobranchus ocellatus]|uniref:Uncharacterized protein n=1 Tax=Plakobranchus ocellatus TaxID=259542 RepID=A0AAV4ABS4_9GAST|nr:hypothetical protein PoB_003083700 [Plakobranchus ocellatus]
MLCPAEDAIIAQWPRQPAQYGYCPHRRKLQPTMSNICKEQSYPDQKSNFKRWQNKQRNISKNCSGKDQLSKDENNPDKNTSPSKRGKEPSSAT